MSRRDARGPTNDLPLDLDLDEPPPSRSGSPVPARSAQPQARPARPVDPGATLPVDFDEAGDGDVAPFDLTPPPPKHATPPPQPRQSGKPSATESARLERPGSRGTGKVAPDRASAKGERKSIDMMGEVPPASALRRPPETRKGPGLLTVALLGLLVLGCTGGVGVLAVGGWYYTRPVPEPAEVLPPPPPEPPPPTDIDGIPIEHRLRADPNGAPPPPSRPQAP
jgi:hypothetical protein